MIQIRIMNNSLQLYQSVTKKEIPESLMAPFVLEPNLEKIAKEVSVKTFSKDSETEIQKLLQMSISE